MYSPQLSTYKCLIHCMMLGILLRYPNSAPRLHWRMQMNRTGNPLRRLLHIYPILSGKNLLQSNRYAAFLSWLVNIKTINELYNYVVKTGDLNFLLTFKLSQDPLENFFGSIRMACGSNNNPTSIQFKSAFQSLLCNTLNRKVVIWLFTKAFCRKNWKKAFVLRFS